VEASMKWLLRSLPWMLVAAGCQPGTTSMTDDTFVRPSSGDVAVLEQALGATNGDGPNGAHIIFLNFGGQKISPASNGQDNPATGASWIAKSTVNMAAFDASPYAGQFTAAQAQQAIVTQFETFYAPFNVQVVTTRPTSGARYTMCVIGDYAETLLGSGAGSAAGIAPLDCGNQSESEITYAFSASIAPNMTGLSLQQTLKSIAVTAAQETAHSYGLNHTNNTTDVMYPQLDPAQNGFVDANMTLIQNSSGTCNNATTQDSKQLLLSNIGASNGTNTTGPLPTVSFAAPTSGQTIPLTFTIIVNASEMGGTISHVDVSAGSQTLFTATSPPYRSTLSTASSGDVELTATAYDTNGNFQTTSVDFTLAQNAPAQQLPPCTGPSDCLSTQMCQNGMCVAKPNSTTGSTGSTTGTTGSTTGTSGSGGGMDGGTTIPNGSTSGGGILMGIPTGGDCTADAECRSGVCDIRPGHKYCTAICDPMDTNSCPPGLSCVPGGGQNVCQKPHSASGCSTVPGAPGSPAETLFGFLLMLALVAGLRLGRTRA
jgi:hypothetical protein